MEYPENEHWDDFIKKPPSTYKQGDIIRGHYPLTDKPAKTKLRPAIFGMRL
jgi:hypothetical protein